MCLWYVFTPEESEVAWQQVDLPLRWFVRLPGRYDSVDGSTTARRLFVYVAKWNEMVFLLQGSCGLDQLSEVRLGFGCTREVTGEGVDRGWNHSALTLSAGTVKT